jgi:hypothetical protein
MGAVVSLLFDALSWITDGFSFVVDPSSYTENVVVGVIDGGAPSPGTYFLGSDPRWW